MLEEAEIISSSAAAPLLSSLDEAIINDNNSRLGLESTDMRENNSIDLTGEDTTKAILEHPNTMNTSAGEQEVAEEEVIKTSSSGTTNSVLEHANQSTIISRRRTTNSPYDSNPSWERFECERFFAYRVLPKELNLSDRAFAISVFLKDFNCRFNCGDIVKYKDGSGAVFLGVRFDQTTGADTLLYFFLLNNHPEGKIQLI